jgi:putative toxin-antitoxin system antitoxin component (TIGR02293 family)
VKSGGDLAASSVNCHIHCGQLAGSAEMPNIHHKPSLPEVIDRELGNAKMAAQSPVGILDELAAHGFSNDELYSLVIPRRTLARRREAGNRLSPEESDRAFRLARITELAERVFGEEVKAHRWLRKPSPMLEGRTPISLLKSEAGAELVEQALHRIDYGMFA